MMTRRKDIVQLASLVVIAAAFGCNHQEEITTYKAPKDSSSQVATTAAPAINSSPTAPVTPTASTTPVSWTLPAGWKQVPAGEMRFAAFQALGEDPAVMVTIIPMPPGQTVLPNINRWEGQVGLAQSSEAEANQKLKAVSVSGVEIHTVELVGTAQTILAAFADRPDKEWFFKMQGPSDKVAAQKASFDSFIQSLKFGSGQPVADPHAGMPDMTAPTGDPHANLPNMAAPGGDPHANLPNVATTGATGGAPGVQWSVPAGWVAQPEKPMRVASFKSSADATAADIIVSQFAPGAFGGMLDNVNRWRGMVGLAPVADEKDASPQKIKIGDIEANAYDFAGSGADAKRVRVILVQSPDASSVYFFRLQGAADAVSAQQKAFDAFVQSLKFGK